MPETTKLGSHTTNLGLYKYDKEDLLYITDTTDSLNHNMEIIDEAFPIRQTIVKPEDDILAKKNECLEQGTKCLRFTPGVYVINHEQSIEPWNGNETLHFNDVNGLTIIIDKGAIIRNTLTVKDLTKTVLVSSLDIYKDSMKTKINNFLEQFKEKELNINITVEEIWTNTEAFIWNNIINKYGIENYKEIFTDIDLNITCYDGTVKIKNITCTLNKSGIAFKYKWFNPDIFHETNNPSGIDKDMSAYRTRITPLLKLNTPKTTVFKFENCSNITICGGGTIQGTLSKQAWYENSQIPKDPYGDDGYEPNTGRKGNRLHNYYYSDWIGQSNAIDINSCNNIRIQDIEISNFYGRGINIGMKNVRIEKYASSDEYNLNKRFEYGYMENYSQAIRNSIGFAVSPQMDEERAFGFYPSQNVTVKNIDIHHTLAEAFMLTGAQDVLVDKVDIYETGSKLSYGFDIEGGVYFGELGPRSINETYDNETAQIISSTSDIVDPQILYLQPVSKENTIIEYTQYVLVNQEVIKLGTFLADKNEQPIKDKLVYKYNPPLPSNNNVIIQNSYVKNSISTNAMTWACMVGKASNNIVFKNVTGVDAGFTLNGHFMDNSNYTNPIQYEPDLKIVKGIPVLFASVSRWDAEVDRPKNVTLKDCNFPTAAIRNDFVIDGGDISAIRIQSNLPDIVTPRLEDEETGEHLGLIGTNDNSKYKYKIISSEDDLPSQPTNTEKATIYRTFNPPALYKWNKTKEEWVESIIPAKINSIELKNDDEIDLKMYGYYVYYNSSKKEYKLFELNDQTYKARKDGLYHGLEKISFENSVEFDDNETIEIKTDIDLPLLFAEFNEDNTSCKITNIEFFKNSPFPFGITTNIHTSQVKNVSKISVIRGYGTKTNNRIIFTSCNFNTVKSTGFISLDGSENTSFGDMTFNKCNFILNYQNPTSGAGLYNTNFNFNECNFKTSYSGQGPFQGGVFDIRKGNFNVNNCLFDLTSINSLNAKIKITLFSVRENNGSINLFNNTILTPTPSDSSYQLSINSGLIKKHDDTSDKSYNGEIIAINNIATNVLNIETPDIVLTNAKLDYRNNYLKI